VSSQLDHGVLTGLTHLGSNVAGRPAGKPCGCGGNCGCGVDDACGLERVRFFPRQLLGADDMNAEQHYFREKLRRHNRFLHGWGVVCGCEVRPAPTQDKPYQVLICPGYVVTPQGDEIMIGCQALFDLATCMVSSDDPCAFSRPCPPVTTTLPQRTRLYLTVCYKECDVRPVRVAPVGCSCDDVACDYSRIRDAYEFACLDAPPGCGCGSKQPYNCEELCRGGIFPCPACTCNECVCLATITIRPDQKTVYPVDQQPATGLAVRADVTAYQDPWSYTPMQIDNVTCRKLLYSTEMLQTMAWCQCGHEQPIAATPTIAPEDSTASEDSVLVDISSTTPNATLYYTIDGTDPDTSSFVASGAVELTTDHFANDATVTVKAIAVAPGYQDSAIGSAVIHANPNP
jgi:hypothetical protein